MTDIRDFITDRLHDDQALADHALAEDNDNDLARRIEKGIAPLFIVLGDHEPDFSEDACYRCSSNDLDDYATVAGNLWPCVTVRGLAAMWDDHPDFDPSWQVESVKE